MRLGLTLPPFGELADPRVLAGVAADAEQAGWDGVFVWDHVDYRAPVTHVGDPWTSLAAAALATERVLLGPMVTPLARRRPQVLARQVAALDLLSAGRLVLGVGLGMDGSGREFARFGEPTDVAERAARYDEALGLLTALLSGEPVDHRGRFFRAEDARFLPAPERPVPVWVAGRWPNRPPLRRAARHDGAFVIDLSPADLPAVRAELEAARGSLDGFDVVVSSPPGDDLAAWAASGATWHLSSPDPFTVTADQVRALARHLPEV